MDILRFPLVKITAFFVAGIVVGYYLPPTPVFIVTAVVSLFGLFLAAFLLSKKNSSKQPYFSIATYLLSISIGLTAVTIQNYRFQNTHYIHHGNENIAHRLEVTLREKLKSTTFGERYVAMVHRIDHRNATGKVLLNFRKENRHSFTAGTNLLIGGYLIKNKPPLNPDQFDYGKYLDSKSIPAQVFVNPRCMKLCGTYKNIWYYADVFRNRIISNLRKSGFQEPELQVVNALLLGQQQEISADIIKDYQYAGAVHILSVSGLHVGFILLFLNFLLSPLPKSRAGRMTKLVITLISLWGFAFVAGLSPSVVRSATMFSFLAYGMYLRRSTNIFHTLVVSILLILIFEPSFLFDVGFQLSYAALFFILWLQPLLSALWKPNNRILKYFWDILTVSFAAQIGALPLSIYYFHQFPGLFFATNLVIIPFLSVIMILGVVMLALAVFDIVPHFAVMLLEQSIVILNKIIHFIAAFESFIIQDIPLNFWMLISLYLLIFSVVLWVKKPTYGKVIFTLLALAGFQLSAVLTELKHQSEGEIIFYNIKKNTLITERNGTKITPFYHQNAPVERTLKSYAIANFSSIGSRRSTPNVLWFEGKNILVIDSTAVYPKHQQSSILLLVKSPKINLDRLLLDNHPQTIIADASNFKSYVAHWKRTCLKRKIPFHHTNEKGYFRLTK